MTNAKLSVNTQENITPSGLSHAFDTGYAIAYGVNEAIMIRNLQHFITLNANRGHNFHEGRYWTYDRLDDFVKHFPYWTIQNVRTIILSLIKQEVIIKGDFNKKWSDRTAWYAFKDQDKFIRNIKPPKTPAPIHSADLPKPANGEFKEKIPDLLESTNDNCWNQQMTNVDSNKSIYSTTAIAALSSSSSLKVPAEKEFASLMPAKAGEMEINSSSEKPKRTRTASDFNPKVREVGQQMLESLIRTKSDYVVPKNLSAFLTEVDFLLRLDKRQPQKLMDVFNWALSDSFWADKMFKPNPAKYLREKFDQLEMKMNAKPENKVDRRTRNKDGSPVDAPHLKDLF